MTEESKKIVSNLVLFSIGITAGIIASSFPRLLPFLSQSSDVVALELFTTKFYLVALIFSLMIGVAMIWMYQGTSEHTKNLFLSALALPAVLSGGINMSSVSTSAEQQMSMLNSQTQLLKEELKKNNPIETFKLDIKSLKSVPLSFIPELFGISTAYAGDPATMFDTEQSSKGSVQFNVQNLKKNFFLSYGEASSREEIISQLEVLRGKGIVSVTPLEINGKFIILGNEPQTEANAIVQAIELKKAKQITAKVVEIK